MSGEHTPHYALWWNGSKTPCFCEVGKDHPIERDQIIKEFKE